MIKAIRLPLTALILAVLPALAFAQKTTYDFDKDVNFASLPSGLQQKALAQLDKVQS